MTILPKKIIEDPRGILSISTFEKSFPTKRYFIIKNVPAGQTRGNHAHKTCTQILICLNGRIDVCLDNAESKKTITLTPRSEDLVITPGIWSSQIFIEPDSNLLVLCDEDFDETEYIREYNTYINWVKNNHAK